MANLLLHSLTDLKEPIFGVIAATSPRHIVEIGSESGGFTTLLVDWAVAHGATVTTIDPAPAAVIQELAARHPSVLRIIAAKSPGALADAAAAQAYIIDGDHNYYTVSRELDGIHAASERSGDSPVVILHDVGWPCARRDQYYAPLDLPAEHVHAHTFDRGVHLDSPESVEGGFRGQGAYAYALREGGPANGVLTAVEDFVAAHPLYEFSMVPAVLGLGIVFSKAHPQHDAVVAALSAYDGNPLLARLEQNRVRAYLEVISLQDREASIVAHRDAVLAERDALRATTEELRAELAAARADRDAVQRARDAVQRERDAKAIACDSLEKDLAALEARWYARLGGRINRQLAQLPTRSRRRPTDDK